MCFCKRGVIFLLLGIWSSCGAAGDGVTESIRGELVKLIEEQGLREGVDRQTGSVVGIGISWSKKEPELAARNMAAASIYNKLNGAELLGMRRAIDNGSNTVVLTTIKKVTEGYITGLREVARVTKRNRNGHLAVGVAFKWTLAQEIVSANAVAPAEDEKTSLAKELEGIEYISRMSGPHFWMGGDGSRPRLIAIGVCEIKTSSAVETRAAIRTAEVKARRYLSLHFCQYNRFVENLSSETGEKDEASSRGLTSVGLVKSNGVIASGLGTMDVMEKIVTEDGRRFAICVTCLTGRAGKSQGAD